MEEQTSAESQQHTDQSDRVDVGVLFVHGIGEQKRSDTLVQCTEALREWLDRWISGAGEGSQEGAACIVGAELAGGFHDDAPAHARLRIRGRNLQGDWLLAESWWAESFPPPKYGDLLRWCLQILPLTISSHMFRRLERSRSWRRAPALASFVVVVMLLPLIGAAFLLSLLIGLLPIGSLRATILSFQKRLIGTVGDSYAFLTSSLVGAATSSRLLNDLEWLYRHCKGSPIVIAAHSQGAAVAHAALNKLPIAGVEHYNLALFVTYGAGLRKLIMLDQARPIQIFVSWLLSGGLLLLSWGIWDATAHFVKGGGLSLAGEFEAYGRDPTDYLGIDWTNFYGVDLLSPWGLGIIFFIWGFTQTLVLAHDVTWSKRPIVALLAGAAYFLLAVVAFLIAAPRAFQILPGLILTSIGLTFGRLRELGEDELALRISVPWKDFYAYSDPVPNGELMPGDTDVVKSRPINNRGSWMHDHSTYWENFEEFVSSVAVETGRVGGQEFDKLQAWDQERLEIGAKRRAWRVAWLQTIRITVVFLGVSALAAWHQEAWTSMSGVPAAIAAFVRELLSTLQSLPFVRFVTPSAESEAVPITLWYGLGSAGVYVVYWLLYQIWLWWERWDVKMFFARENFEVICPPFAVLIAMWACIMLALVSLVLFQDWVVQTVQYDRELVLIRSKGWTMGLAQPHDVGLVTVVMVAIPVAAFSSFIACKVLRAWRWGEFGPDVSVGCWLLVTCLLLVPAVWLNWMALGVNGVNPVRSDEALVVAGILWGAMVIFSIVGVLLLAFAEMVARSAVGRSLEEWSASQAIGSWLARNALGKMGSAHCAVLCRAEELVNESNRSAKNTQSMTGARKRSKEAADIARLLCLSGDCGPDGAARRLAGAFPYAAIEMAKCLEGNDPSTALVVLQQHRSSRIPGVRWFIRNFQKRVGAIVR